MINALRRRLDEMKQLLAATDRELREKQREIERLHGKLAAASPLTDAELRRILAHTLDHLAQHEIRDGTAEADEVPRSSKGAGGLKI